MTDANTPIAGWYPDPENPPGERWWNGTGWSDHRRGGSAAPYPASEPGDGSPPPPPNSAPPRGYAVAPKPVPRFNTMALTGLIVSLSTFVIPLFGVNGIVGAVFGFIGLRDARRRQEAGLVATGRGLAIGAIASGIVLTLLVWAGIVLFFVFIAWITALPYGYVT